MIYLDNAATSFPKPDIVKQVLRRALSEPLGNPGRGGHAASMRASDICFALRESLNVQFCGSGEERVIFCKSATEAINLALFGALFAREDCPVVVTSIWEHNAVLRPLYALWRQNRIRLRFFDPVHPALGGEGALRRALCDGAALCAFTCRSNVTGVRTDYPAFCRIAKERGALVLLDASQEAGKERIALSGLCADYLCFPAHKGLCALPGLGILMLSRASKIEPRVFGGTGFAAQSRAMPALLPEALEAGTLPVHLIAALNASIRFLRTKKARSGLARADRLAQELACALSDMGYRVLSQAGEIVLCTHPRLASEEFALRLAQRGVCARGGAHCAPLIHRALGTSLSGAVRFSLGIFTTERQIAQTIRILRDLR